MRSELYSVQESRGPTVAVWITITGLTLISSASAQYSYNPAAADEHMAGIRYFGSAKDDRGSLLDGVSVLLDDEQTSFVFVTDQQGRFHGYLPLGEQVKKVSVRCFKVGFQLVRVIKRPGPQTPKPTMQVDCVLRALQSR